jgi:glycosyltransferase involved in cell wall biosynthesis
MFQHLEGNRGTEQVAKYFNKNIIHKLSNIKNFDLRILPGIQSKADKEVILWLHNFPNQYQDDLTIKENEQILQRYNYKIKKIIAVSEFHKKRCELFFKKTPIHVCNNGFYPSVVNYKKFDKVSKPKLIYSSIPQRGLDILLSATKLIDLDFELYIFSDYQPDWESNRIFDKFGEDSRIFFFGQTPNKSVRKICDQAHIFSYPCIYEETFCLSLVEAMSSGCLPVCPLIGAIPEISNECGIHFLWSNEFLDELDKHGFVLTMDKFYFDQKEIYTKNVEIFAEKLYNSIEIIKKGNWNPKIATNRANLFNWSNIENQWKNLDLIL